MARSPRLERGTPGLEGPSSETPPEVAYIREFPKANRL